MSEQTRDLLKEVYSCDFIKIVEGPPRGIYRIIFSYPNSSLINSLIKTKIIQGGTSSSDYKVLQFKANSVKTLKQFQADNKSRIGSSELPVSIVAQMTATLATQLSYIIKTEKRTLIGYNSENVIVINDKKFAFLGSELVTEIEDNMSQISYPFSKTDFFVSPELLKIKTLPSMVHYKTAYFSLACLILGVLLLDDDYYNEYIKDGDCVKMMDYLNKHRIKGTKLYWLLSRCLVDEPEKRCILFI